MPPRKKARSGSSSSEVVDIAFLSGGHAEKPGTIAKFRSCSDKCGVRCANALYSLQGLLVVRATSTPAQGPDAHSDAPPRPRSPDL